MNDVTVLGDQQRTSRGKVCCNYCWRTIAKGTRYQEQRIADNGYAWTWRECPACQDAYSYVYDWVEPNYHLEEAITPDDFQEWSYEVLKMAGIDADDIQESGIDDRALALAADNPQAQAALRWVERTSRALHPDGITNYA